MLIEVEHHNFYPNTLGYKTFLKYYPTRFKVNKQYEDNRRIVFSFKEGNKIPSVDILFIKAIADLKNLKGNKPMWICPIPSSTIDRTKQRYSELCSRISNIPSIHNGYSLLTPIMDREEVHTAGNRNYDRVLSCIKFDTGIYGKNIILIDDVITTGKSFRLISNKMLQLGAASVFGIVLAKTHWVEDSDTFIETKHLQEEGPSNIPPNLEYWEPIDDDFFIGIPENPF